MERKESVGSVIKKLLVENKMSKKELGNKLDKSRNTIYLYLEDKADIPMDIVFKLSAIFKQPINIFLKDDNKLSQDQLDKIADTYGKELSEPNPILEGVPPPPPNIETIKGLDTKGLDLKLNKILIHILLLDKEIKLLRSKLSDRKKTRPGSILK